MDYLKLSNIMIDDMHLVHYNVTLGEFLRNSHQYLHVFLNTLDNTIGTNYGSRENNSTIIPRKIYVIPPVLCTTSSEYFLKIEFVDDIEDAIARFTKWLDCTVDKSGYKTINMSSEVFEHWEVDINSKDFSELYETLYCIYYTTELHKVEILEQISTIIYRKYFINASRVFIDDKDLNLIPKDVMMKVSIHAFDVFLQYFLKENTTPSLAKNLEKLLNKHFKPGYYKKVNKIYEVETRENLDQIVINILPALSGSLKYILSVKMIVIGFRDDLHLEKPMYFMPCYKGFGTQGRVPYSHPLTTTFCFNG